MKLISYIFSYPLIWIISILPFPILYFISDCIFVLLFYVIRYRRKTVQENLKLTLPNLSDKERKVIEKKFYHYLCDMFLEMGKTLNISDKEIEKRFVFTNLDLLREKEKSNKSIVLFCAHYGSWEWITSLAKYTNFEFYAIYKKIENPYFDNMVADIRSRFGGKLIEMKSTYRVMANDKTKGVKGIYLFAGDQSPMIQSYNFWLDFMNIEVPIYTGGETMAKKMDMNTLYLKVKRVGRGYYEATFIPLEENVKEIPDFEITTKFMREVEKQIYETPENYFWTHKRWKHRGKNPNKQ